MTKPYGTKRPLLAESMSLPTRPRPRSPPRRGEWRGSFMAARRKRIPPRRCARRGRRIASEFRRGPER